MSWSRGRTAMTIILLAIIPAVLGLVYLSNNAPRDWALHWLQPHAVVASASSDDFASVTTPQGYDVLWTDPGGRLFLSRFDARGRRLAPDLALRASAPITPTLGRAGSLVVAAWREDTNGGSRLRAAVIRPGHAPSYRLLASGPWPLEHPRAFTDGRDVGIVFSWQRAGPFDVYLTRLGASGQTAPVRLTHVGVYAFNPHAVIDTAGRLQLVYMSGCCQGAFRLMYGAYTPAGSPLGRQHLLDTITSTGGSGESGAPSSWGLAVTREGRRVWVAWAGDQGLTDAAFDSAGRLVVRSTTLVPLQTTFNLAFAVASGYRELVWEQSYDLGVYLGTLQVGANGAPLHGSVPDRVAFESAASALPQAVTLAGKPAVLYQTNPAKTDIYRIELSRYSPRQLGPPSIWARLGLGLANPVENALVLILGALAIGLLITVANVLILMVLILAYLVISRLVHTPWRWYLYAAVLTVAVFLLFVLPGAQSPPLLFLTALPYQLGVVTVAGMTIFVALLARTLLRRFEDVYRAGMMAFTALYFIAFLEALTLVQGTVAKI